MLQAVSLPCGLRRAPHRSPPCTRRMCVARAQRLDGPLRSKVGASPDRHGVAYAWMDVYCSVRTDAWYVLGRSCNLRSANNASARRRDARSRRWSAGCRRANWRTASSCRAWRRTNSSERWCKYARQVREALASHSPGRWSFLRRAARPAAVLRAAMSSAAALVTAHVPSCVPFSPPSSRRLHPNPGSRRAALAH
jgi:hypothetical protein